MQRPDGRTKGAMRPVKITTDYTMYAEGSVLVEMGNTKVICTASVEEKVPPFLEGKGLGWVTAEYAMLPRATNTRKKRDIKSLKLDGRSSEIQRLIGRALRAVVDREALGERQITIDCDVIQADGRHALRVYHRRICCTVACMQKAAGRWRDRENTAHCTGCSCFGRHF